MAANDVAAISLIDTYSAELALNAGLRWLFDTVQKLDLDPETKATMLTKLLENHELHQGFVATIREMGTALRAEGAVSAKLREQRDDYALKLETLEYNLESADEDDPRVADLMDRVRSERDVVPEDDVHDIVAAEFRDMFKTYGQPISGQQVGAFLDAVKFSELDGEFVDYFAQWVAFVAGKDGVR